MTRCPGCGRFLPDPPHVVTLLGFFPVVSCPQAPGQLQLVIPATGEVMALVLSAPRPVARALAPEIVREGQWR